MSYLISREELLQNAKPVLFNTEMVRAMLDGRKTVTRRICKDANEFTVPDMSFFDAEKRTYAVHNYANAEHTDKLSIAERKCPICPGDILYVRETWFKGLNRILYRANYSENERFYTNGKEIQVKWKPSLHMPKEAARIFLKVKDVRVERLQECGKGWCLEIEKEGVVTPQDPILYSSDDKYHDALREEFQKLWDSTIKKSDLARYGWAANPWVFVIEFERIEPESEV